jgi:NAD(P)-dependent dehydrogenase (short-subunit alcohol dehydrogenase family)
MKGRHVLVTGASGGLGGAVLKVALARGAVVTATHRDEAAKARLGALGVQHPVPADATIEADVRRTVDAMPQIDALVHLVGGFVMAPTHEVELDAWRRHHDLVLTTTFLACKHALRRMRERGYGRIVTIGSRAALEPMAQAAAYSAAKAGVVALTRAIAAETRGTDVTANCVLPSVIDTAVNRAAMGSDDAKNWVSPESLAEVICFLGSSAAGDLRGAAIPVYGNA